ncbi:unnamed protein product [Cylicostephanus goldi]|uniref:Uncharacterized protein n=1 Tax=Cylicostephanus goldi TaxID=71465 RepID=A0A3P6S1G9_CYLGO|nr:unnamed protein product [Cylicostephanus goldi]
MQNWKVIQTLGLLLAVMRFSPAVLDPGNSAKERRVVVSAAGAAVPLVTAAEVVTVGAWVVVMISMHRPESQVRGA